MSIKSILRPYYLPILHKLKYWQENKRFSKNSIEVFKKAHHSLVKAGVFFWPEFGTLLGIHRDGKLIGHDTDLDFGIFLTDYSDKIEFHLKQSGFRKKREFLIEGGSYGREESYILKGVSLDLFYFTKTDDGMYTHLFPLNDKKEYFIKQLWSSATAFKEIIWEGMKLSVPQDTEKRLIDTYGKDYHIPIKNWYTPDDALSSRIINKNFKHNTF